MLVQNIQSSMDSLVHLPPLSLESMTKAQLCDLIPKLITMVTGRGCPQFGREEHKPHWWPNDVPWTSPNSLQHLTNTQISCTEILRQIVRSCYNHSGHENLLSPKSVAQFNLETGQAHPVGAMRDFVPSENKEEIFVCSICLQSFLGKDCIHQHQSQACPLDSDSAQLLSAQMLHNSPAFRPNSGEFQPFVQSNKSVLHRRNSVASWVPKQQFSQLPDLHPAERGLTQEEYLAVCGLVTNSNANRLKQESECLADLDCLIVAVKRPAMESRPSPRTAKSLMSQLSQRDSNHCARKRLRFSYKEVSSDEDNCSDMCTIQTSLLGIAVTSPLGQRLKKHFKADNLVSVIAEVENFCKVEQTENGFQKRLRYRPVDFPVTFRKKRGSATAYCHTIRFNKAERREFMRTLHTGLNKRGRRLYHLMKRCSVSLERLTEEEIQSWTLKRRTILNQEIAIDEDISITQVDIPESSYLAVCQQLPVLSAPGFSVQEHSRLGTVFYQTGPPWTLQRPEPPTLPHKIQQSAFANQPSSPLPQFLVKKVSKNFNGQESQKLVFVPLDEMAGTQSHHMKPGLQEQTRTVPVLLSRSRMPQHRGLAPKTHCKQILASEDHQGSVNAPVEIMPQEQTRNSSSACPQNGVLGKSSARMDTFPASSFSNGAQFSRLRYQQQTPDTELCTDYAKLKPNQSDPVPDPGSEVMQLSIDAVYSAADLSNQKLAASLGLQSMEQVFQPPFSSNCKVAQQSPIASAVYSLTTSLSQTDLKDSTKLPQTDQNSIQWLSACPTLSTPAQVKASGCQFLAQTTRCSEQSRAIPSRDHIRFFPCSPIQSNVQPPSSRIQPARPATSLYSPANPTPPAKPVSSSPIVPASRVTSLHSPANPTVPATSLHCPSNPIQPGRDHTSKQSLHSPAANHTSYLPTQSTSHICKQPLTAPIPTARQQALTLTRKLAVPNISRWKEVRVEQDDDVVEVICIDDD